MGKLKSNPDPASENHSYEVEFFAKKHGLSLKAARVILYSNGPSRTMCDAAAKAFVAAVAAREQDKMRVASTALICGRSEP
ncbi:hypothetical protein EN859_023595 [Mesorhizobium sp. M00.F.Ca.ET.216.01.1.1]|nr:hypothetical protein EN859_023595 [Mesorhizobium sp. M00.F.Ca.ET.216.01.1.1]